MSEQFPQSPEVESASLKEITLSNDELDDFLSADPGDEALELTLNAYGLNFGDSVLIHTEGRHDAVYNLSKDDFMTRDMNASFAHQKKNLSFMNKIFGRKNITVEDDGTSLPADKINAIVEERALNAEGEPIDLEVSDEMGENAVEQVVENFEEFVQPVQPEKKVVKVEVANNEVEEAIEVKSEDSSVEVAEEALTEEVMAVESETVITAEHNEAHEQIERIYQERILNIKHELDTKLAETSEVLSSKGNMREVFANLLRDVTARTDEAKMLRALEGDPEAFRKKAGEVIAGMYKTANGLDIFAKQTTDDVIHSARKLESTINLSADDAAKLDRDHSIEVYENDQSKEFNESHDAFDAVRGVVTTTAQPVTYDVPYQLVSAASKAENATYELKKFATTIQEAIDFSNQNPNEPISRENLQTIVDSANAIAERYSPTDNQANEKHLIDIENAIDRAISAIAEARS